MKQKLLLLSLLFLSSSVAVGQTTLDECRKAAEANYPLARQYDLIRASREYSLANASKGYLPQVSLAGKATYQSDVTKLPVDFGALGQQLGIPIDVPTLNKGQYTVSVEVNQTLYDGGHISSRRRAVEAEADVNQSQQDVGMYAVREQVDQLYFGILVLDEQLRQNDLLDADLRRTHDLVSAYIYNGVASPADLDAVSVEIIAARQRRIDLEASRTAYLQMLSLFTGRELTGSTFELPAELQAVDLSANHRPELRLFDAQTAQLDAQKSALNARLRPQLGAFVQGAYGNPGLNMLSNKASPYYVAGVRLSWNFGALYTRTGDLRTLENARRQIAVQRDVFLFHTRIQSTQLQSALDALRRQMQDDDEIIRLRGNVRRAAEAKVAEGTMTVTDMLREITAESLARNTRALHRVQLLKQLYDLKNTLNQ